MQYFTQITDIRETDEGTDLIIRIPGEKLRREIAKYNIKGKKGIDAEIRINDGRTISVDQRKKIYATIRDISTFTGDEPDYLKEILKYDYCAATGEEPFSLSNCSISTAREFINHLIDFILKWNIPLTDEALNRTEDADRYLYGCIKYRRCCITGRAGADIHHVDSVGMGRNRNRVDHSKLRLIALSREWHNKVEQEGEKEILDKYKIYGILIDRETLKDLGLNYEEIVTEEAERHGNNTRRSNAK